MRKMVFTLRGWPALTVQSVHAGAVGEWKHGSSLGLASSAIEGGKVAVVAIQKADSGSDDVEIYDQAGTLVATGFIRSVGGLSGGLGLVTWTPSAYRILHHSGQALSWHLLTRPTNAEAIMSERHTPRVRSLLSAVWAIALVAIGLYWGYGWLTGTLSSDYARAVDRHTAAGEQAYQEKRYSGAVRVHELGIRGAHHADHASTIAGVTMSSCAEQVRVADGAADDAAQHVAALLVRRHDAVGDQERHRAGVLGEDAQRHVGSVPGEPP